MIAAAFGWLTPIAGALTQKMIDVAVILNALRALGSGRSWGHASLPASDATALREEHMKLEARPCGRILTDDVFGIPRLNQT
jgi:hypothetical protein